MRIPLLLTAVAFSLSACSNAGQSLGIPALSQGSIGVLVYLDRDGSRSLTTGDTTFAGVRVALLAPGGIDTIRVGAVDTSGFIAFDTLPIGTYRIAIDRHALGDSIGVIAGDTGIVRITADSASTPRLIRLGFTEVSIAAARALPAGERVFIRGTVTSPLQFFSDSSTFLGDTSGAIRVTSSRHQPGRSGNNIGDSVLVLGTTGSAQGEAVLVGGLITDVGIGAPPVPLNVTVAQARTANGGKLDATLIAVTLGTKIVDTIPSGPDFIVRIVDPSDNTQTVDVFIDQIFQVPHGIWGIGLTFNVRGVLVPRGDGTWLVKPRGGMDVTLTP